MTLSTVFVIAFAIAFYMVLVRESIVDLKIEYVPNNIILEAYSIGVLFFVGASIIEKSWKPVTNALLSFGFIFLAGLVIWLITYIKYRALKRNKGSDKNEDFIEVETGTIKDTETENKNEIIEIELDIEPEKKEKTSFGKINIILFVIYIILLLSFVALMQTRYNKLFTLGVFLTSSLTALGIYFKTKKITAPIYTFSLGLVLFYVLSVTVFGMFNPLDVIVGVFAGIGLELICYFIYRKFYEEGDYLTDENGFLLPIEEQSEDVQDSEEAVFAMGGGDLIIFGAMSLLTGLQGIIPIFINSAFVFFAMLIGFAILRRKNLKLLPFVPAITIGFIMYLCDFNIINVAEIIENFAMLIM